MREILFKAKRKNWRELPKEEWWVEGYPVKYPSGKVEIHEKCIEPPDILKITEIDPETFCQHTGLTDKSGNRIWENDIVDTFETSSKEFLRNVIKFTDGCFKVFAEHYLPMYLDNYEKTDFEVQGNVFDNRELLERTVD